MLDLNQSRYFKSLPKLIQESIMQSGADFNTEEELHTFAASLQSK